MKNRPKIEDYFTSKRYETTNKLGYSIKFDSGLYEQALNSYIDQLEKALDKACCKLEELDKWAASIDDGPVRNKGHWKEWCMRDEEDNRQ